MSEPVATLDEIRALMAHLSEWGGNRVRLVLFRDGRQRQMRPAALGQDEAGEVIFERAAGEPGGAAYRGTEWDDSTANERPSEGA